MILLSGVLLSISLLPILGIIYLIWLHNYSHTGRLLSKIPGPKSYPIFGTLPRYLPITAEKVFKINIEDVKKYGFIYREWFLYANATFITHPDDVELVLSSSSHIKKSFIYKLLHNWLSFGLLTSGGSKWKQRRRILTPAFHFSILKEFIPIFNKETHKLVKELHILAKSDQCVKVLEPITRFTLYSIAETSMGVDLNTIPQKCEEYKEAMKNFSEAALSRLFKPWLYTNFLYGLTDLGRKSNKAVKILHNLTRQVISERKKTFFLTQQEENQKLTMLDLLLQHYGVDIDDEGIAEEVDTFMFEGHDTTAMGITMSLVCLANHPDIQNDVYQEIIEVLGDKIEPSFSDLHELNLLERCIKESLRLLPSVPFISREASKDIPTTTGYVLPKDSQVHMYIYHIHRNPDIYPDPEKFDPDRFLPENSKHRHPYAYLPFSAGPRNCIGQRFAMLELKTVLCGIIKNFILEPIDRLEDIIIITDFIIRTKNQIRVKIIPRNQS